MTENSHHSEVLILLSTFNGEIFLDELLTSLSTQKEVNITVLVRDDGSTDRSLDILENYADKLNLKIIEGTNEGLDSSYKILMNESKKYQFDYVAFCDQDDVWMPDKLARSISMLRASGKAHYASKRLLFRRNRHGSITYPKGEIIVRFHNSIFENVAPGCTMVIARDHFNRLMEIGCTELKGRYDHILYLVSSALKENYFDQKALIHYRIHSSNAVGIIGLRDRSPKKISSEIRQKFEQLEVIYEKLKLQMDELDSNLSKEILYTRTFRSRLKMIFGLPKMRQRSAHDFFLKLFLLFR